MKNSALRNPDSAMDWLPDMDLNHDKQIQSLLCYRYTIGQTCGFKVEFSVPESRPLLLKAPSRWRRFNACLRSAGTTPSR